MLAFGINVRLIACLLVLTGAIPAAQAARFFACPADPPSPSRVRIDAGGVRCDTGRAVPCTYDFGGASYFPVTRVVGPGDPALGRLAAPGSRGMRVDRSFITNRVVSEFFVVRAVVNAQAGEGDSIHGSVMLKLNGRGIGVFLFSHSYHGPQVPKYPKIQCLQVPIDVLHFGVRQYGAPSIPGENVVEVSPAITKTGDGMPANAGISLTVEFDAMPPILLLHGWNSKPEKFAASASSRSLHVDSFVKCWPQFSNIPPDDLETGFAAVLLERRLPFDCQTQLNPVASITGGGDQLAREVSRVARQFGAHAVHVVAHSKGGLWTRGLLMTRGNDRLASARYPAVIASLTTINTPHLGSLVADLIHLPASMVHSRVLGADVPESVSRTLRAAAIALSSGSDDLRPGSAALIRLNELGPPPSFIEYKVHVCGTAGPQPGDPPCYPIYDKQEKTAVRLALSYDSLRSDADLDDDGNISLGEVRGMGPSFAWGALVDVWHYLYRAQKAWKTVSATIPRPPDDVVAVDSPAFNIDPREYKGVRQNDLVVSADSAACALPCKGFPPLEPQPAQNPPQLVKRNHNMNVDKDTAAKIATILIIRFGVNDPR